jgi:transposase
LRAIADSEASRAEQFSSEVGGGDSVKAVACHLPVSISNYKTLIK